MGFRFRRSDDDDVFAVSQTPGAFLGSLTAVEIELPAGFEAFRQAVVDALGAYQSGAVSRTAVLARLSELQPVDVSGVQWALGATSTSWYSRDAAGQWQAGLFPQLPTYDVPSMWDVTTTSPTATIVAEPHLGTDAPDWANPELADEDFTAALLPPSDPEGPVLLPREGSVDAHADTLIEQTEQFLQPGSGTGTEGFAPPPSTSPDPLAEAVGDGLPLPPQGWHADYLEPVTDIAAEPSTNPGADTDPVAPPKPPGRPQRPRPRPTTPETE